MKNARLKLNIELFKKIYLIRMVEKKIIENYEDNEMKTPMHMSMGEEAIVSGVCQALDTNDLLFGTYRSHGLYLARTEETDKFFGEMYGKVTGVVKGKGGSMHFSEPDKGLLATSAIVASTIPVATGAAFSLKVRRRRNVCVVFFGDGAIDEGTFWESLNMACLFKLPILFVCEDNGFAVHTPGYLRHGYKSISDIVSKFNCVVLSENSTDAEIIFKLAKKAKDIVKKRMMPVFLYVRYYRYLEHVGIHEDFDAGYRNRKEFENWAKKDPLGLLLKKLRSLGLSQKQIDEIRRQINLKIGLSLEKAKTSQFPQSDELLKDVFYIRSQNTVDSKVRG